MAAALGRLRKRSEFLAVAATNRRWASPGLVLQARKVSSDTMASGDPAVRVGFTATKKIGNAVARNRAKRRLRAAVHEVATAEPLAHRLASADLVLVARPGTLDRSFADLKADLANAMRRLEILRK